MTDFESYLSVRIGRQIDGFYRPRADELQRKLALTRWIQSGLAVAAIVLAAVAGIVETDAVAVWVPVVTTVGGRSRRMRPPRAMSTCSWSTSGRRRSWSACGTGGGPYRALSEEELVRQAEHVISIQNEGWMAKLTSGDQPPATG